MSKERSGKGSERPSPTCSSSPGVIPQARLAHDRGGQDLGAAVDAGHAEVAAVPGGPGQEGGGDVGGTGADVEDGQGAAVSGQHADGPRRQLRAPEPSIRPLEVAQVATQGGRIVQRPIQQFLDIGHALHPSRLHADYHRAHDRRRRRGPHGPDRRAGRERGREPRWRSVQHRPDDRPPRSARHVPRPDLQRPLRRDLRANLARDGVSADGVIETDDPTTLALVELDEHGVATYRFYVDGTSAAGLTDAEADAVMAASARPATRFTSGRWDWSWSRSARRSSDWSGDADTDRLVMLDPNCRPSATPDPAAFRARIDRIAGRADVVKVSDDDLRFLAPDERARGDRSTRLLQNGARVVLRTHGSDDVEIRTRTARASVAVPPVDVVDTVGAGDVFGGGFLASWVGAGRGRDELENMDLVCESVRVAVRAAALSCTRPGADPPTWPSSRRSRAERTGDERRRLVRARSRPVP